VPPQADDSQIRVILLDIEGTTTPVDFVYKTLFPYASRKVESFLREHFRDPETQSVIAELRAQRQREERDGAHPPIWQDETDHSRFRSITSYVQWLMERDSKCTPLKALQGEIWQEGYARGELRGEVYEDVPPAFTRWRKQGREISIYSSGSELAQRLLFRSTSAGDLSAYISRFFDTRVGAKTESHSYAKIAELSRIRASEFLFVSDTPKEVEAARLASMHALVCARNRTAVDAGSSSRTITTFDQIFPE
jgi:enolase-phosphatase E1